MRTLALMALTLLVQQVAHAQAVTSMTISFADTSVTSQVVKVTKFADARAFYGCDLRSNPNLDINSCVPLATLQVQEVEDKQGKLAGSSKVIKPIGKTVGAGSMGFLGFVGSLSWQLANDDLRSHGIAGQPRTWAQRKNDLKEIGAVVFFTTVAGYIGYRIGDWVTGRELSELDSTAIELTVADPDILNKQFSSNKVSELTATEFQNALGIAMRAVQRK